MIFQEFQRLYEMTSVVMQDVMEQHCRLHGFVPQEQDISISLADQGENSSYHIFLYTEKTWHYFSTASHENIDSFLRYYTKVLDYGHYSEGYYRKMF